MANRRATLEARDLVSGLVERQRMQVAEAIRILFAPHERTRLPVTPDEAVTCHTTASAASVVVVRY